MFAFTVFIQHPVQTNFDETIFKKSVNDSLPDVNEKQNIIEKINNDDPLQKNIDASLNTAILVRGPYMNLATQTGIIIRWRTDIPTDSRVIYGTVAGNLTDSVIDSELTTEHIVQLTGLTENTQYFYSIGSSAQTLQGDSANYFKTLPPVGSKQKIRILVMGDMGTNSSNQKKVLEAYLAYNANSFTNMWLMLGDNAYNAGLDSEFQNNFFNIYQTNLTKNHVMWPAPAIMITLIEKCGRQTISLRIMIFFLCPHMEKQVAFHQIRKHIIHSIMEMCILYHWILMDGKQEVHEYMIQPDRKPRG